MDDFVLFDGNLFLSDFEEGVEKEGSKKCGNVFPGSTSAQLPVVAYLFWVAVTFIGANHYSGNVDIDYYYHEKTLSNLKASFLSSYTLPFMGKLCDHFKCLNFIPQLENLALKRKNGRF